MKIRYIEKSEGIYVHLNDLADDFDSHIPGETSLKAWMVSADMRKMAEGDPKELLDWEE